MSPSSFDHNLACTSEQRNSKSILFDVLGFSVAAKGADDTMPVSLGQVVVSSTELPRKCYLHKDNIGLPQRASDSYTVVTPDFLHFLSSLNKPVNLDWLRHHK